MNEWDELRRLIAVMALRDITQLGRTASIERAITAQRFSELRAELGLLVE